MTLITKLESHQVFVFGSNSSGFHGAGAAGLACRGITANTWRTDEWFKRAMQSPEGHEYRRGKWAMYGVGRGFQEGTQGKSYAIVTVTKPGAKRSMPLPKICQQLEELWDFMEKHPEWEFLLTPLGQGYAGYSADEMAVVWGAVVNKCGIRKNASFMGFDLPFENKNIT